MVFKTKKLHRIIPRAGMILAAGIAVLMTSSGAMAQSASDQGSTITLGPAIQRYSLDAGSTKSGSVTVVNTGKAGYDFVVYASPYSVKNLNYDPDYISKTARSDAYGWVQLDKTSYHLDPGQRVDVTYQLRVPEKASPGGHYGVIFAEVEPPVDASAGQSVIRKKRIGTVLYTTVNGDIKQAGSLVKTTVKGWQTQPPLTASLQLKNSGNTDFVATTTLTVKDLFGRTKYSLQQPATIFPDTTREVALKWDDAPWFGLFKVGLHTTYLDKTVDSEHYVLLMPRWLPVIIIVIGIAGLVYAAIRRRC